jgi:hypothetical protein
MIAAMSEIRLSRKCKAFPTDVSGNEEKVKKFIYFSQVYRLVGKKK